MTRISKQGRRRAVSPRKHKNRYALKQPVIPAYLPFKMHENAFGPSDSVFVPKIK
ncbi:hypothetical protein CLAVI_000709 [Candidatus Clavichlamydia salmonicola]|uniref:hypothetical protein n=1 Tax=Candidatus Clavichlamydia salmonicola TaxID=469812 RepID=UPI001890B6E2|nr:hypothetical protein [Candidatus Clavichlamydia salmonicola]MBF5051078.1 hypothetical protein [Candidatus Clavichlamydia salmonicola]